ncbi:MAG: Asd/ArgC dimerization domain-containing protein [Acidobacteriaceae bacterium]
MPETSLRIAIVGAATLMGKALNDELANSVFGAAEIRLLDDEEEAGKLSTAADEIAFIQRIEADSFHHCDFVFFAGPLEQTQKHWKQALQAGCRIVDLSGALESSDGVMVRAPWVQEESAASSRSGARMRGQQPLPDLHTRAVVSAHPVAVLLALLTGRSLRLAPVHGLWATLLQPASEYGHAALEELHHQTTNLLSFQPLPTEVFGGQTAFNLAVSFGPGGVVRLATAGETIRRHFAQMAVLAAGSLALQIIQVPVFHGYALSVALEFAKPVSVNALMQALTGPHVHLVPTASEFPGNVQAVEEAEVQLLVQPVLAEGASSRANETQRFWMWIVADNLKFAAQNAIACAAELNRLRPRGSVQ